MKREIKFRGQRIDNKEWIYGNYSDMSDIVNTWLFIEFANNGQRQRHIVIPETVGQFSGLKDKNGVDIYEGDILKDDRGKNVIIEWHNVVSSFCLVYDKSFRHYFAEAYNPDQLEVIGSIHSNPELIK